MIVLGLNHNKEPVEPKPIPSIDELGRAAKTIQSAYIDPGSLVIPISASPPMDLVKHGTQGTTGQVLRDKLDEAYNRHNYFQYEHTDFNPVWDRAVAGTNNLALIVGADWRITHVAKRDYPFPSNKKNYGEFLISHKDTEKKFRVIVTHFEANEDNESVDYKRRQFLHVTEQARRDNGALGPTFVAGDFNWSPSGEGSYHLPGIAQASLEAFRWLSWNRTCDSGTPAYQPADIINLMLVREGSEGFVDTQFLDDRASSRDDARKAIDFDAIAHPGIGVVFRLR